MAKRVNKPKEVVTEKATEVKKVDRVEKEHVTFVSNGKSKHLPKDKELLIDLATAKDLENKGLGKWL